MSSHASSPSSPISTTSTLTEERSNRTMADVVKDLDTEELIDYLQRRNLKLNETHFKIFRQQEISGLAFLDMTEEKFRSYGLKGGPSTILAKFIEDLGQKLRSFPSYKTLEELKEVLRKYPSDDDDDDDDDDEGGEGDDDGGDNDGLPPSPPASVRDEDHRDGKHRTVMNGFTLKR